MPDSIHDILAEARARQQADAPSGTYVVGRLLVHVDTLQELVLGYMASHRVPGSPCRCTQCKRAARVLDLAPEHKDTHPEETSDATPDVQGNQ